jgi:hypothetical protein
VAMQGTSISAPAGLDLRAQDLRARVEHHSAQVQRRVDYFLARRDSWSFVWRTAPHFGERTTAHSGWQPSVCATFRVPLVVEAVA